MASVQELLMAAESENRASHPGVTAVEGLLRGFHQTQQHDTERAIQLLQAQKMQQEMQIAQAAEQRKAAQRAKHEAEEQAIKANLNSVGGLPSPVLPSQKLKKIDEEGNVSEEFSYGDSDDSLNTQLSEKVRSGEMTIAEAFAMKNHSGGGVSNELLYRMQQDQQKAADGAKAKNIPGYTRTGEVELDDVETRKLRESVPEFETFKTALTDYKSLINKYGTWEPTNRKIQGQMDAISKNLQLKVKNLAQLGVLSASDVPYIEKQIPPPGVLKTKQGMLGALDTVEKLMQTAITNKMKVGGYAADEVAPADDGIGWSDAEEQELKALEKKIGGKQ